jgi:hypothetical protein
MAVEILVPLGLFTLIGFIVWIVMNTWRQRAQLKATADFNAGILNRISSLRDFSEFVQTEQGAKFMDSLAAERASSGPRDRVLRTTQVGVVVTAVGLGLLFMAGHLRSEDAMFAAGITLSLGLGLLLSSAVSYWLARSLGVLHPKGPGSAAQ